ncbi:hypothetical protein Sjap_005869 [Stephania japonica]|uniref:Uncharacterized protein n=1 Tax=Stephania japonica TaxID=461633 RepID=A0AAP0K4S6_9MAGN
MICSTSTTKSTKNWLDRLCSLKGFSPLNDDADLEDFLIRNPKSDPYLTPQNTDQNQVTDRPKQHDLDENRTKRDDWFDVISSSLAELFVMGESKRFSCHETRSSRKKRQNPRLCAIPASATASVDDFSLNDAKQVGEGGDDRVATLSPSSADNSVVGAKTKKRNGGGDRDMFTAAVMEAEADRYSRVDVTVIDTSAPVWRSERMIFRKESMWKVKDNNSKYMYFPDRRGNQLKRDSFHIQGVPASSKVNPKFFTTLSSTNKSDAGHASNQNYAMVLTVEKVNCNTVASGLRLSALRA